MIIISPIHHPNLLGILLLLWVFLAPPVAAQIVVDRTVLEFSPSARARTVIIGNNGGDPVYVTTELTEVINPAISNTDQLEFPDPRTAPVIANPRSMLLLPGQRKQLRLFINAPDVDKDRIYKLKVKPYIDEFTLNQPVESERRSAIKVSLGYKLLLMQRPANPNSALTVNRDARSIVFVNSGNSNVLLKDIRQCERSSDECNDLGTNRLYAGESLRIDLPKSGKAQDFPVRVREISNQNIEDREY